jgi:hypothetical protein
MGGMIVYIITIFFVLNLIYLFMMLKKEAFEKVPHHIPFQQEKITS